MESSFIFISFLYIYIYIYTKQVDEMGWPTRHHHPSKFNYYIYKFNRKRSDLSVTLCFM